MRWQKILKLNCPLTRSTNGYLAGTEPDLLKVDLHYNWLTN